jgi:molybdate transport system substrate-binding protein
MTNRQSEGSLLMKRRFGVIRTLAVTAWMCAAASAGAAQDLTIASASDLQAALPGVVSAFEQQTGRRVRVTFGSSGNFFTQIQNGAPFDLYFSADIDYPRRLEQAGLAEPGTLYEYATGHIVLWTAKDSGIDVRAGLQTLRNPAVRRIAIANPEHAPYGRAAVAALRGSGLYDQVQSKLVLGENISQAAQFAQSGNAQVGIIALSIALAPAMSSAGTYVSIPASSHPPIEQAAVIVRASQKKAAARDFLRFIQQPGMVALMERFGFEIPKPAAAP